MIFNLDKAKSSRSKTNEVIVVEGYMDVLSLYSKDIKNVIANSGTALTDKQINLIWNFFPNPIICLDGDQSGQNAALRIAEKLLPFISDENKIYFSILPNGTDPDEFIKQNNKEKFVSFLNEKQIIQDFVWFSYLNKINRNNPFEVSKFEKEIKKICYSIKDETLKKYVLEDFLERLKKLTPIQNSRNNYKRFKNFKKNDQNYKILNETKSLYNKSSHFSKIQLKEFSVLFIMLNYLNTAQQKIDEISQITFLSDKNESLKKLIVNSLINNENKEIINSKIRSDYDNLIKEIQENSSIHLIVKDKKNNEISELLDDLLLELKELNNLKKIESLEKELINNLDENSYSELLKLKSQLNRD